jgi:hypothetical protein
MTTDMDVQRAFCALSGNFFEPSNRRVFNAVFDAS